MAALSAMAQGSLSGPTGPAVDPVTPLSAPRFSQHRDPRLTPAIWKTPTGSLAEPVVTGMRCSPCTSGGCALGQNHIDDPTNGAGSPDSAEHNGECDLRDLAAQCVPGISAGLPCTADLTLSA